MLIYINIVTNKIIAYNNNLSKHDLLENVNNRDCFWVDGLDITYPTYNPDTQFVEMYLNDDNITIRYIIIDKPIVSTDTTLENVRSNISETKTVLVTSEDARVIMEYQTVLDEKLSKLITHLGI